MFCRKRRSRFITITVATITFFLYLLSSTIHEQIFRGRASSRRVHAHVLVDANYSTQRYPNTVIVTLAGGDTSARHLVALIRSLRDVNTELPIVVLLARGGLGSAVCINNTWKALMNRSNIACGGPDTIGESIVDSGMNLSLVRWF